MAKLAVYPGSFDPITLGHLDIIARAAKIFENVRILVVHNPEKVSRFGLSERVSLIQDSLQELKIAKESISVATLESGLLVDYCKRNQAEVLVKGFRSNVDLDYELPMAKVNRDISGIETVFMASDPRYGLVASSLVKQVADLGGPIESYVTECVAEALRKSK